MIHLAVRRIHPDHVDSLRQWFAEVDGPRRAEALATLAREGVDHEIARIVSVGDEHLLVYAMESDDLAHAHSVASASALPLDVEHRSRLFAADAGSVAGPRVLDLRP